MTPNMTAPERRKFSCWLDQIIEQQAAHYGLTVEQHARLMGGAADYQERIDTHEVEEPDHGQI